jgi:erythromycin esterase-like protein
MTGFVDASIGKETDPKSARNRPSAQRLIRWDWRRAVVLGLPTFMRGFEGRTLKDRSSKTDQ